MNWYSIFYWISVADGIKMTTGILALISGIMWLVAVIGVFVTANYLAQYTSKGKEEEQSTSYNEWKAWSIAWKRSLTSLSFIFLIMLLLNIMVPSRKDALIIVAGGAVGNFITKDTSARQIPTEVMNLLRAKIQSEIKDLTLDGVTDTVSKMSREQLEAAFREKTKS